MKEEVHTDYQGLPLYQVLNCMFIPRILLHRPSPRGGSIAPLSAGGGQVSGGQASAQVDSASHSKAGPSSSSRGLCVWKVLGKWLGLAPVATPFAHRAGHAVGTSGWSGMAGGGWAA